jgi:predicted glycosyltransferase
LDEAREYVTILVTAAHKPTSNEVKILDHIIEHCNKNDIDIIFKTKMKYDDFYRQNIKHEYFFNGNDFYHQTLSLMLISNFTVGFSTSASLEAELIGTPFISFWRTEKHDQEFDVDSQDLEFFYENFDEAIKLANKSLTYRMAQSDNIFVIKKSDRHEYNRIKDDLDLFLQATCAPSCAARNVPSEWPKFLAHSLWREIY